MPKKRSKKLLEKALRQPNPKELSPADEQRPVHSQVRPSLPLDTNIKHDSYDIQIGHPTADGPSDDEAPPLDQAETGIPDIGDFGPQDTRFGGEDLSGMSEWSMRARSLELDDGLDAGDYRRPDNEIIVEAAEALESQLTEPAQLQFQVRGGELTIEGWISSKEQLEKIETAAQNVPGVKEVHNCLELRPRPAKN